MRDRRYRLEQRYERLYDRALSRLFHGATIRELAGAHINWAAGLHDDETFAASLNDIETEMRRDA